MTCKRQKDGITMHERFQTFLAEDSEDRLWRQIIRRVEDPLKPRTSNCRFRINPILLVLGSVIFVGISLFLVFGYGLQ
jgi:hypothetical protein